MKPTFDGHVYRGALDAVRARAAELREHHAATARATAADLRGVFAARVGRVVGGSVAVLIGLAVFAGAAGAMLINERWDAGDTPWLTWLLLGGGAAAIAAWGLAKAGARAAFAWLARPAAARDDAFLELARMERGEGVHRALRATRALETWALVAPLVGFALLAPLTLHYGVARAVLRNGPSAGDFGEWIRFSVMIVSHAHAVLIVWCVRHVRRLRREGAGGSTSRDAWKALAWTVGASAVPGIVLVALPPILTGVTGIVVIVVSFAVADRTFAGERLVLGGVEETCQIPSPQAA